MEGRREEVKEGIEGDSLRGRGRGERRREYEVEEVEVDGGRHVRREEGKTREGGGRSE